MMWRLVSGMMSFCLSVTAAASEGERQYEAVCTYTQYEDDKMYMDGA